MTTVQVHETVPSPEALAAAGVAGDAIAPALAFGSRLGSLRPEAADGAGAAAPGIPVIAGVNDGTASMLGAGLRAPGDAVDTGGTSGGIAIYADRPVSVGRAFLSPAPLAGLWVVGGAMAALGASVDWMRTAVLGDRWTPDELFSAAAGVAPGADGLVFLPYLAGERAPIFDEEARGVLFGLTLAHGPEHLARAALEGAAFAMRHVAEPLAAAGAPVRELRLAGRPSAGDVWARIKADVLGVPVAIPTVGETAVLGAAILAAVGVGAFASLEAGVAAMTSVARRLEPDPAVRGAYDDAFATYKALYPALRPVFDGGAGLARLHSRACERLQRACRTAEPDVAHLGVRVACRRRLPVACGDAPRRRRATRASPCGDDAPAPLAHAGVHAGRRRRRRSSVRRQAGRSPIAWRCRRLRRRPPQATVGSRCAARTPALGCGLPPDRPSRRGSIAASWRRPPAGASGGATHGEW